MSVSTIETSTRGFVRLSAFFAATRFLTLALCLGLVSTGWADFQKTNPVTGETESYTWKFVGTDTWNGTGYWQDSSGANPSGVPAKTGENTWDPILFDGNTININAGMSVEGWNLRMGLYNGANVTMNTFVKYQGGDGVDVMWMTVDETSSLAIGGFGKGNISLNKVIKLSVAGANGITWDVNLESTGTANNTFEYYLKDAGSVSYQAVSSCEHKIKMADVTLSGGTKSVQSKTLVSFTSSSKAFTADATIKALDSVGTVVKTVGHAAVRQSGETIANTVPAISETDAVATVEIVQCSDGIVLYWVDGDPAELVGKTYLPSISLNFTHEGAGLTTAADIGIGEHAVPGTSWNNINVNSTSVSASSINGVDTTGQASLASGVSVVISGTRGSWQYTGVSSSTDVRQGYIDDSDGYPTPQIVVEGIPYSAYKLVLYFSNDTDGRPFGHLTVNGTNYKWDSANSKIVTCEGVETDCWGTSSGTAWTEGGNYLVFPAMADVGGKLTIVGHRWSGSKRMGVAAMQIVEAEIPDTVYSVAAAGDVTWSTKAGLSVHHGAWASGNTILLENNQLNPVTITFDEAVESASLMLYGGGTTILKFGDAAYNGISSFDFFGITGEVLIDDDIITGTITSLPQTGSLRFAGSSTLSAIPFNGVAAEGAFIIDQPMTSGMDFLLEGKKVLLGIDGDRTYTFTRFVIANSPSVQAVEQYGGNITVTGDVVPYSNQASVFLGHYGGSTSSMKTLGGTFTATGASASLGWDGVFTWTIGDGVSANDAAVVTLPGMVSGGSRGGYARSSDATLVLKKGGTLAIGADGIQMLSGNKTMFTLAGGTLRATADTFTMNTTSGSTMLAAGSETFFDTGVHTLTVSNVLSGAGAMTKVGDGTLVLVSTATATGTLTVSAGTLTLGDDVIWPGTVSVGENGTLDITDVGVSESETIYIPVGGTLTLAEGATVKLNGTAINTDVWELSGGTFINKTLKTAVTTATDDFAFSTATWESVLTPGAEATIDWAGSLSEVRVHANNDEPATATVDVTAANVSTFIVDGSGSLTIVNDGGMITAQNYLFEGASTTLSGTWGNENTLAGAVTIGDNATLRFSPGGGNVQGVASVIQAGPASSTVAISNGTLDVTSQDGGNGFFKSSRISIEDGGILKLDVKDATGYSITSPLTIERGGLLDVRVRDTLCRPLVLNGGSVEIQGVDDGRAFDFYNGTTVTVNNDAAFVSVGTASAPIPKVQIRSGNVVFSIADGATLTDGFVYVMGNANSLGWYGIVKGGAGKLVQDSFGGASFTYSGDTAINAGTYVMNATHENNGRVASGFTGAYTVASGAKLKGAGAITGTGGVVLAAATSKLCGSLTIANLTAMSGGIIGEDWAEDAIALNITNSLMAAGTLTLKNGSFTIGADCVVTNAEGTADTTAATFSIATNGNLKLEKNATVGGLSVADGGTITLVAASKNSVPAINVAGDTSYAGNVNFVIDFGSASAPASRTYTLMTDSLPNPANVTVSDGRGEKKWKVFVDGGALKASSSGSFALHIR